jgi:hypothetical protein
MLPFGTPYDDIGFPGKPSREATCRMSRSRRKRLVSRTPLTNMRTSETVATNHMLIKAMPCGLNRARLFNARGVPGASDSSVMGLSFIII